MKYCPICNIKLNYKSNHIWRAHSEKGISHGKSTGSKSKGRKSHRKGLTKETSEEINRTSQKLSETLKKQVLEGTYVPRKMSDSNKEKLSIRQSLKNTGGKCKWFEYNGQYVQGTWELNIVKKLDELNIKWYRPKHKSDIIEYKIDGKIKKYTPDLFLIEENIYIEIKGYWWGDDKKKMEAVISQNKNKKIIIEKNEYEKILRGELVW